MAASADPCRDTLPPTDPRAGSASDLAPGGERRSKSICIIDDDDWVSDSLTVLLEAYGFTVRAYSSGAEFLADQPHCEAACLIVDQHMPGLDGLDVIAALRREGISVPAILITGRLDAGIAERAKGLGVVSVLEKPFAVPRLLGLIRAVSEGRELG